MGNNAESADSEQARAVIHALVDKIWDSPMGYVINYSVSMTEETLTIKRGNRSIFSLLADAFSK